MKKNILFFVVVVGFCSNSLAQTVVASGFGEVHNGKSSMSISIGQMFVKHTNTTNVGSLHSGVQQAHELDIVSLIEERVLGFSLKVFPNPVLEELEIKSNSSAKQRFSIVDMNGKAVVNNTMLKESQKVNLSSFSDGVYFLVIESPSQPIYTYKIIKK